LLLLAPNADTCYCIQLLGALPASFCWLLQAVESGAIADCCYWTLLAAGCCCQLLVVGVRGSC